MSVERNFAKLQVEVSKRNAQLSIVVDGCMISMNSTDVAGRSQGFGPAKLICKQ